MKAPKQTPVQAVVSPRSFKDAGYQTAQLGEGRKAVAQFVLEKCPGFLDKCPDEVKTELFAGFQLRAHELWGSKTYRNGDTGALIEDATGGISIDVNVAMAYTGQAFGKMKDENPALHGLLKAQREKFSKYASNCMSDLRSACKRILNESTPKERSANKSFHEAVTDAFDALDKRAKVGEGRGDVTANQLKFRLARDAFWKALKD
jgi:hypothetical protein